MRWPVLPLLIGSPGVLGQCAASPAEAPRGQLTVRTITGSFTGLINPDYPNIREFRNIPYAQPPLGPRRWLPPVALPPSKKHHFSYRFPPPCAQYSPGRASLWNSNITDFNIRLDGQSFTAGASSQTSSEDCLSLAVWTPLSVSADDRLPVVVFVPGGSFTVGGINIPYQNPAPWVSRTQQHVAVVLGYRLNIFGYPHAAGLEDNNVGIRDVRMALEWVYANVAAFGGDPDRITMWGHSAGAVAVDMLNYGWYDDVLAAGFFMMSGTAMVAGPPADPEHSNFTFVAKNVGCDFPDDAAAEIACMRQVPAPLISNFVGRYSDNRTEPILNFKPRADDKVVFSNYTARTAAGLISKSPALVSTTSNEQSGLIRYPEADLAAGPNKTEVDKGTVAFVCLASNTTDARARRGLTTYRYQFAGNYTSLAPLWWMGSFHGIDVPLAFGTYRRRERDVGVTEEMVKVSEALQDYLFAFIADPGEGLRRRGWLPQEKGAEEGGPMLRFGWRGRVEANISSTDLDYACLGRKTYDPNP